MGAAAARGTEVCSPELAGSVTARCYAQAETLRRGRAPEGAPGVWVLVKGQGEAWGRGGTEGY